MLQRYKHGVFTKSSKIMYDTPILLTDQKLMKMNINKWLTQSEV